MFESTRRGDMSELHQHWPNPEQALLKKQQAEKARADAEKEAAKDAVDAVVEEEYARHVTGEDYEIEKPEEGFVTDDPAHNDPIGGVVGSRRMGRYAEEAKFPNRKWKRGDKHRGTEKPHKQGRRPTGAEGREEDLAA